jgi:hypothetical protein
MTGMNIRCNNCGATADFVANAATMTWPHTEIFPGPIKPLTMNATLYTDGATRGWTTYYNGAVLCPIHLPPLAASRLL